METSKGPSPDPSMAPKEHDTSQARIGRASMSVDEDVTFMCIPVAVVLVNNAGLCLDANPAACTLLGQARQDLRGSAVLKGVVTNERPESNWASLNKDLHPEGRTILRRTDDVSVTVDYLAATHIQPGVHLVVLIDASERMSVDARLAHAQAQVREVRAQQHVQSDKIRAQLARDLHDELGQLLGALRLEADVMEPLAPRSAHRVRHLAQQGIASVRDLSRALRPAALDLGLIPALHAMAIEFSRLGDIDIQTHLQTGAAELSSANELMLFRVAQEALANAIKYAGANRIMLNLSGVGTDLLLEVIDDGCGLLPQTIADSTGLGIVGMRERCCHAGAHFMIDSVPGRGTRVSITLPQAWAGATP